MAVGKLTYTQTISWLKVVLPVSALILLSTLFLFAKSVDPTAELPFADLEVDQRISNQQITSPFFSGEASNGNAISFWAESAAPNVNDNHLMNAEKIRAHVKSGENEYVVFSAESAVVNSRGLEATLNEDVEVTLPDGAEILAQSLHFNMQDGTASSDTEILASTNFGQLKAGAMLITSDDTSGQVSILFTNGINLVYTPVR